MSKFIPFSVLLCIILNACSGAGNLRSLPPSRDAGSIDPMAVRQGTGTLLLSADAIASSPAQGFVRGYSAYSMGAPAFSITGPYNSWITDVASDKYGHVYALEDQFGAATNGVLIYNSPFTNPTHPDAILQGLKTGIGQTQERGLAVDSVGRIYVRTGPRRISIFSAMASGDVYPIHTITTDEDYNEFRLDGSGNIYVSTGTYVDPSASGSIEVLPAGQYGNVIPIRRISGTNTLLRNPVAIAIDGAGTIYAFNYWTSAITEYSSVANGDAKPVRTIAGSNTNLSGGYYAMAVCTSGLVYALANGAINVFSPGANGNVAPAKKLQRPGGLPTFALNF